MSMATAPAPSVPALTPVLVPGRLVLSGVSWEKFEALLAWAGDRRLGLAYDRGELELMSPSAQHEDVKCLISLLISLLAIELDQDFHEYGSVTWRREDLDRAVEPDTCFYLRREPLVRGRSKIDLAIDPAPDLVVEIDITSSSLDREGIYAALGVPELWRYDGTRLLVLLLGEDGRYVPSSRSQAFPTLPLGPFAKFIEAGHGANRLGWIKEFRRWVREEVLPKTPPGNAVV